MRKAGMCEKSFTERVGLALCLEGKTGLGEAGKHHQGKEQYERRP